MGSGSMNQKESIIWKVSLICIITMAFYSAMLGAVEFRYNLELATRGIYAEDSLNLLIKAMPTVRADTPLFSHNLTANMQVNLTLDQKFDFNWEIYRLWLRYASFSSEIRIGRQRLNFGPARLLRSLQWFDQIDPEDMFQHTSGVDALLFRHFQGRSSLWLWGMLSKERLKGLEHYPSVEDNIEVGGRFDFPLLTGYIGLITHYRPEVAYRPTETAEELRFGLDGRWDYVVGLWFEAAASFIRNGGEEDYSSLTLGADYSRFGMTMTAEHFLVSPVTFIDSDFFEARIRQATALSVSYPFDIIDELSGSLYYEHETDDISAIVQWQRTYDHWKFGLGFFSYAGREETIYSGEGVVLTIQYNI